MDKKKVKKALTKAKVRAWLETFAPHETVGVTGDGTSCPLHHYLVYAGCGERDVTGAYVYPKRDQLPHQRLGSGVRTKPWVERFTRYVDRSARPQVSSYQYPVTKETALKALNWRGY